MAKQLRLDVAQLTDVGRKREHNEDNMAYVIPKDSQVMAKKGALFIVADGMGGHAAGEVASEIAVDSVSKAYYQDESEDVAASLTTAIKRANTLIHQRAAENMLRSGMGTTCVAAVLRGNMAYIANVGDSRAYLVRNGQVRQVSQDHSWVAEQVRAGLLTEDQARTHAQRNVITRALGTQMDVEIDVFPEQLEENDSLVLCTDGLSGLVSDEDILRIVGQSAPQESVYHLVERANENGGPDNITAIVVQVQDVGWEPPTVRRPVPAGVHGADEDTAVLGVAAPATTSATGEDRRPSSPLSLSSTPYTSSSKITSPQSVIQPTKKRRSRLFIPTLAVLIVLIIAIVASAAYYYVGMKGGQNADQTLQTVSGLISKARSESATNPDQALQDLASAQRTLHTLQSTSLTTTQRTTMTTFQGDLTSTVKSTIRAYNQQNHITALASSCIISSPVNQGSSNTQIKSMAAVQDSTGKTVFYALGTDNNLYKMSNNASSYSLLPLPSLFDKKTYAQVEMIASNGTHLVILWSQPAQKGPTLNYFLGVLSPNQTKLDMTTGVNPALVTNGQMPTFMTAEGTSVSVVLSSPSSPLNPLILSYGITAKSFTNPMQNSLSVSQQIVSVAAFPNNQLFLLLADGSIQSTQGNQGNQAATSVFVQPPIAPSLGVSASDFSTAVAVPTITPGAGNTSQIVPGNTASLLVVGSVNSTPHLYVLDVSSHRILDLVTATASPSASATSTTTGGTTPGTTPLTLHLQQQYTSSTLFAQLKNLAFETSSSHLDTLTQAAGNASPLNLVSFKAGTPAQSGCIQ